MKTTTDYEIVEGSLNQPIDKDECIHQPEAMIPVHLTTNQLKTILKSCEDAGKELADPQTIYWDVYPGRLIVKIVDERSDFIETWSKPINDGRSQGEKITCSINVDAYKMMIRLVEKKFLDLSSMDDLVYIYVTSNSCKVFIEHPEVQNKIFVCEMFV